MIFLSVLAAVLVSVGVIAGLRWLRAQYRDFCELRLWAINVQREVEAAKAKAAKPATKK